jgi:tetratricopeptide (TPR) repeat protein
MRVLLLALLLGLGVTGCRHAPKGPALSDREQAALHLSKKDFARALPLLEALHRESPEDLDLARGLVEAHVRSHRSAALIARLEASDEGRPPAVTAYMLGLARFAGPAEAERAIADFERAATLSPGTAELHYRLGLALLESERYGRAMGPLERAHQLSPERRDVLLPLAKARARAGDRPGAVDALRRLVESGPPPQDVAVARSLIESVADPFEQLPRAARGKLEEGLVWLDERDVPQQAIVAFEEILREFPDAAVVHALLGLGWQRVDDAGRAVEEFKRAIELSPWDGRNHLYLALLYQSRQRAEQAAPHFERALELNPLLDEAWMHVGDRALERRELDRARRAFTVLRHLQPDWAPARGKLSLVMQLQGDFAAADRELRAVLALQPQNVEFMLRLGLLHFERHGKARTDAERAEAARESEAWLRQVLAAQPENAVASRALEALRAR